MYLLPKRLICVISNILIVAIILTILPHNVFAVSEQDQVAEITQQEQPGSPEEPVTRIGEITAKRERNKKFYLNSDATITAEIYAGSIHYQESGTWQEIDNTIIEDKSVAELPLRNKGNDFQLRFARQFTGKNKLVSLRVQNNVIFFSPDGASKSRAEAGTSAAAVLYRDVYPNIDFEYIADNDFLKENIIINKYGGKNSFSFIVQSPQLTPELRGNEVYFVAKDGTEVFIIPAPFMYDQTNEENCNFVVSLEHQSGPHYKLTYTADEAWLTDPDRVYPVVIDPVVWTKQSSAYSQTRDTFADSKSPTSTHKYYAYLKSGKGSGSRGITRSYIMFPTLPEISAANEIVSAELRLWQSWTTSSTVTVNAHQVTNTWDSGTLTWNNQPTYNAKVLDYQLCKDKENWRIWNVTQTVKDWYKSTPNYGFLIKHAVESQPILDFYSSDKSIQSGRPLLVITYRNNSGIEDYLSYTSMDLGRSGGASVNNYNGNLVYTHTDVSLPGNRMPMTISHVYNADQKASQVGYGSGWRLNLSQTLTPETIQGVSYMKYIDGDGTIHHFLVQSNKYYLQTPGLYLELVKNSDNTYTMKDTQNNQLKFSSAGNLIEIKNRLGDKITLGYSNNRITTVTDGAGRVAHLTYNASNILTKITDPAGRAINFTYSGTNLYKVTYPDNAVTVFAYSASKITKVTHPGGQYLQLTYYNDNDVSKISCYGSDGVLGQSYAFNYWVNATTITDRNNRVTTYIFNNDGNPRNIIDSQGNAACLTFEDNLLVNEVPFRSTTINLLRNHNLERSEEWTFSDEGESTATGAYVSGTSFHGSKAIKISKTNTSGLSFFRQNQNMTKGQTYTLSAYLKTADIAGTGGAILIARYKDSAGSWVEERSVPVTGTKDWQRLCLTFTFPANSSSTEAQICLALAEATGTVWYDCPQLEKGPAPTCYNLVENSSFELDSDGDGMPDRWSSANLTANDKAVTNQKRFDSKSLRIYGSPTVNKNVSQNIRTSGSKGDTFVVSGWAKARSVPRTVSTRRFALCLGFYSSDPTVWKWIFFNDDYTGWQFLSGVIQAPVDYTSISVYGIYYHIANEVYFDGFQVNKEPVSTYSYDDKGNIISAKDTNNAQTSFTYNSTNDLIKAVDPKGGNFTYQYNSKRNLVSAQSPAGTCYSFAYDGCGNIVESSLGHLQNPNLVSNGDFSMDTTHWDIASTNNSGTLNHDNALELISIPSDPNNSISAWQEIDVKANTTYTLSGKIKTQLTEGEAYFRVDAIDNTGSTVQVTTNQFVAVTGSNDWLERVHTFTTDANAAKVRVHLCLTDANSQGSAWFDAIQLEEGSTVSAFNMLSNSDFEQGSSGVPSGFKKVTASGSPVFTLDSSAKQGSKSAKISASSSSVGYLALDQEVHLKPNTRYTISFWIKGTGLTASTTVATAYCTDSSGQNSTELFKYLSGGDFEWRNVTKTFTTPDTGTYLSNLQLGFVTASSGQVFFDAVTLKEEGVVVKASYTSDYNYLRKIYDIAGNATATYNYTTDGLKTGEVASVTDGAGNIQAYTYDILSRVKEVSDNTSGTSVNYTYNNLDSLQKISRAQFDYVFAYDSLGRMTQVKAGSNTLVTHAYDSQTGNLVETTFGNNQALQYTYDALDRLQGVKYNNSTKHLYDYDARGNIVKVTDNVNNVTTYYTYDLADRLLSMRDSTGRYVVYEYDKNNNATGIMEVIDGISHKSSVQYNEDNTLKSITINSGASFRYFYDEHGRPNRVITRGNDATEETFYTNYHYNERGLLGALEHNLESYTYEYDAKGNITKITEGNGHEAAYTYDSLNQLKTETRNTGTSVAYAYDSHGNMTSRTKTIQVSEGETEVKEYVYTYGLDRLVGIEEKVNGVTANTKTLTYDGAGNLLNDGEFTYTWQMGRQLQGISGNDLTTSYKYNENGLRTQKTINGQTHEYTLLGSSVTREIIRDEDGDILWTIHYSYAADSTPVSMNANGAEYYYLKNAQGDITHIVDSDGNEVAAYEYDAWGNHLSVTGGDIAELNPYRYRGYRYDSETGLFYVGARYYDPEIGRFINADAALGQIGNVQGSNMFAYAFNNPVMYDDPTGNWPKLSTIFTVVAVAAAVVAVAAVCVATAGLATVAVVGGGTAFMATATTTAALGVAATAGKVALAATGAAAVSKAAEKTYDNLPRNHTVYGLQNRDTKQIEYVGRTTNPAKRAKAHEKNPARSHLEMVPLATGLNALEARGIEQMQMLSHHTINTANRMNNQINGISPFNPKLGMYMEAGRGAVAYLGNQISNEILYWTGN